jgi:hypothetical protein
MQKSFDLTVEQICYKYGLQNSFIFIKLYQKLKNKIKIIKKKKFKEHLINYKLFVIFSFRPFKP